MHWSKPKENFLSQKKKKKSLKENLYDAHVIGFSLEGIFT